MIPAIILVVSACFAVYTWLVILDSWAEAIKEDNKPRRLTYSHVPDTFHDADTKRIEARKGA